MKAVESIKEKSLADIAAKHKFSIVDGPFGTQLHASEYKVEGVPVVRVVNTSYAGQFISEKLVFISEKKAEQLKRSKVVPGDVIIAKTGATIGKSGIFPNNFSHGIIASSCIKLTVDQKTADHRFVGYLIQSWEGQNKIIDGAGGSTRTTINTKPFGAIRFLFPPKPEQTKIAEILSTVDRAIEQTEAIIAKQQRIKTGLMQDLLTRGIDEHGNIRSEETHEFKDSPLGRIPVEWVVQGVTDICSEIFLGLTTKVDYVESGVPLVRAKDINTGRLLFDEILEISAHQHRKLTKYRRARRGDVLISKSGTLGICALVDTDKEFSIYESIIVMQPNAAVCDSRFLLWLMRDDSTQSRLLGETVGSTVGHLNLLNFRKLKVPIPSTAEQGKIAVLLGNFKDNLEYDFQKLSKLRSLKNALMQDLLTGKKRVTTLMNRVNENDNGKGVD